MIPSLRSPTRALVPLLGWFLLSGVTSPPSGSLAPAIGPITPIHAPPRAAFSAGPSLTSGPEGTAWLTWFDARPSGQEQLMLAGYRGGRWTAPRTVAVGDSFYVNWAEIPGMLVFPGGHTIVYWPWQTRLTGLSYGLRMVTAGATGPMSAWIRPHDDNSPTPHGFASMAPTGDGAALIWIDGRNSMPNPDSIGDSQLRTAFVSRSGKVTDERVLDPRVCECCRTSLVPVPGGLLAAYRGRTADEVRDIQLVRMEDGAWGKPYPLHADGWRMRGCPVNGPALSARGSRVVAAWEGVGTGGPQLEVAFSDNGGRSFAPPIVVEAATALGRPQVLMLEDGTALLLWQSQRGRAFLAKVARVDAEGRRSAEAVVGTMPRTAGGYPLMARAGDNVLFAWTDVYKGGHTVKVFRARLLASKSETRAAR